MIFPPTCLTTSGSSRQQISTARATSPAYTGLTWSATKAETPGSLKLDRASSEDRQEWKEFGQLREPLRTYELDSRLDMSTHSEE